MNVEFTNGILSIDDKLVDGNQIRAMSDRELKHLLVEIYRLGVASGVDDTYDIAYNNGYNDGYSDGYADYVEESEE